MNFSTLPTPATKPAIDLGQALKMRLVNKLTFQEIADYFGVTKSAVHQRLNKFQALIEDPEALEVYDQNRVKSYGAAEMVLMRSLTDANKLKKASVNNLAFALDKLVSWRRLETGQSTSNHGIHVLIESTHKSGLFPQRTEGKEASLASTPDPASPKLIENAVASTSCESS